MCAFPTTNEIYMCMLVFISNIPILLLNLSMVACFFRLIQIFARFDEVKRSGNMLPTADIRKLILNPLFLTKSKCLLSTISIIAAFQGMLMANLFLMNLLTFYPPSHYFYSA